MTPSTSAFRVSASPETPLWNAPDFRKFVVVSLVAHALIFGMGKFTFTSTLVAPPGIVVGIASLEKGKKGNSAPAPAQQEPAKAPAEPAKPEPEEVAPKQARTDVTPDTKAVVLNAKKKEKPKPATTKSNSAAKTKPTAQASSDSSLLSSLQDLVKRERGGTGDGKGEAGGTEVAGVMGQLYIGRLQSHLSGYFNAPPGSRGTFADIHIVVDSAGRVIRQNVDQSSGDALYDDAAMRAIQRAQPLPPPPADLKPPVELTLRMRPKEG